MKQSEILELLDAQEIDPKGTRNFRDIPYCWERVRELVLNSLWHDAKEPPKEGGVYFVCYHDGFELQVGVSGYFNDSNGWDKGLVMYWMSPPEPPERKAEVDVHEAKPGDGDIICIVLHPERSGE
jgi:hypothetical protein